MTKIVASPTSGRSNRPSLAKGTAAVAAFAFALTGWLGAPQEAAAQQRMMPCPTVTVPPAGTPADTIVQEFPADGNPMRTAWRVSFRHAQGKGLYITGAWFKRAADEPWMQVIFDARVQELFVPYHSGSPRFYDIGNFNFPLVDAGPRDAGHCGTIIDGKVVKQVVNRGLMWKQDEAVRYGHELRLWATLGAANYNYVMMYSFRDDGTIALRVGATSKNLPSSPAEAHMHDALWRVDMDLNGFSLDTPYVSAHTETIAQAGIATDDTLLFNGGIEGFQNYAQNEFTEIRVRDTATNDLGRPISYEFKLRQLGTARHFGGPGEAWSHHDFWVTRYNSSELDYVDVPSYVDGESLVNSDIVVWANSAGHHEPRDEDGFSDGSGVALLMFSGLDIRPRDLFSTTPFYPADPQCTAPEWDPVGIYTNGDVVSRNGNEYRAWFWTQGDDPELPQNNGPQASGKPWSEPTPCPR